MLRPAASFLLAQRANTDLYPPVAHQARLLVSLGEVRILDAASVAPETAVFPSDAPLKRVRVRPGKKTRGRLTRVRDAVAYWDAFRHELQACPAISISYEVDAAAMLLASRARYRDMRRIVHLHEVPDQELLARSRVSTFARRYMLEHLDTADLVVVPDEDRARLLVQEAKLKVAPAVVMNCPLRLEKIPVSLLLPYIREHGHETSRIVHYQGAIGSDHGLARVIESMPTWPIDSVLALVGGGPLAEVERLKSIAAACGVTDRILWIGRVPYHQVLAYAVGATVGVTILEPSNNNWKYAAGASNKRFEYAALGIPQVTNTGPGIDRLFTQPRIATAVSHDDTAHIGAAIGHFLTSESGARSTGDRARRMHLESYNYQTQFGKVLGRIQTWIAAKQSSTKGAGANG